MIPERYFPFASPRYKMQIGAGPIPEGRGILEPDELLEEELALKRACFAARDNYYYLALPGSGDAQREAAEYLTQGRESDFKRLGDSVQEDLLVLTLQEPHVPLIAGHLCFPNAWSLDEKLGRSFLEIHAPVPGFAESIGTASQKLLERLKPGRPVERLNWAIKANAQLDLTNRWADWEAEQKALVTEENAGERCYLRVERQTLSLLPKTNSVLFTLHTYLQSIATLTSAQRSIVRGVVETCPPEMLAYKGIAPFAAPLKAWLRLNSETLC